MIEINRITDVINHVDGLKGVIFDLDDTLYGEKEYIRSGYHKVANLLPQIDNCEEKLWNAFEKHKNAFDDVLKNEGIYSTDLLEKCIHVYRFQSPNIHLYDGVREMLSEMQKSNIFLGIITDGRPEGQHAKIEALNIATFFKKIIITDELGGINYRKPNKAAFCLMQEAFEIPYEKMAYIGDNLDKDFIAPIALGMRCIWFRNPDGLYSGRL